MRPSATRVPLLFGLLAAVIRLALAFRDLPIVDRLFVPDDTYYTLAIARSLALGLGPAADGVNATSGFQPLIAFLLTPFFAVNLDPDTGLRAAIILMAVADGFAAGLLALLAQRLWGPRAGVAAGLIWAFSPMAIANALGGLETSLALAIEIAFAMAAARAWESKSVSSAALAGVLAGLALLARVDSAMLVVLVGSGMLLTRRWRLFAVTAGVAAAVVAPWWITCLRLFGSPVPSSGAAVREIVAQQHAALGLPARLSWAGGTLVGAPVFEWRELRQLLFRNTEAGVFVFLMVALLLLVLARALRARPWPEQALVWFAAILAGFYPIYVPALWFMRRYLAPVEAVLALGLAGVIAFLWNQRKGGAVALAIVVLASAIPVARWLVIQPEGTEDASLHGAKGYRDAALEILSLAPEGAVIGSLQSGALSYFAPAVGRGQRIVNLDGVVDSEGARAYRERHLLSFARKRGVTHLADWPFNLRQVAGAGVDGSLPETALRVVGQARLQGSDRFVVLGIEWSAAAWNQEQ